MIVPDGKIPFAETDADEQQHHADHGQKMPQPHEIAQRDPRAEKRDRQRLG